MRISTARLATVIVVAACSGGKPAAPPAPAAPLPAYFDLARVPPRPQLTVGHARSAAPFVIDPTTGKYVRAPRDTTAVDSTALDTNDARSYYAAGVAATYNDPADAAAAFYWASRIDPAWANPYFGRWYTLTNAAQTRATLKRMGKSNDALVPDSTLKRLDSLMILAEIHDPFVDEGLSLEAISNNAHGEIALVNSLRNRMIQQVNQERMAAGYTPLMDVRDLTLQHDWQLSYADRHFDSASADLAKLIKKHPDAIELYIYRAKAQYYLQQYDSSAATLSSAVGQIDKRDTTRLLPIYISREMLTYSIAMANQQAHRDSAAKATFQQTVTENLGFYMAHLHLGSQALAARDTATAISEARIAAEIRPDDPVVQLFLGYSLVNAGRIAEGIEHLQAATTADPYFALPYYYLGQASEMTHDSAAALAAYRAYLAHASRHANLRSGAETAIAMLSASH
jgi:tetratricopeptide (TPR) repeat protein